MRIDHSVAQPLVAHLPDNHGNSIESTEYGNHTVSKDTSYRLLQTGFRDPDSPDREICPPRMGSKVDGFERKGQAWFVATELQSDLLVEVGDMSFHLHKFPLLSRSGKLNRLVFDSRDTENGYIKLDEMPGGAETFELAAKFCYGVALELNSANVAALRCAAEYLEMTEDLDVGNLVSRTEAFLSFVVLASWKDSVNVLHSCEKLLPWADHLQIVRRCCESIAWKACTDPRGMRWSFTEQTELKIANHGSPLWTGPKSQAIFEVSDQVPSDWWVEDICIVRVGFFTKIIQAIRVKGMKYELLGSAIVHYAMKWLPGLTKEFLVVGEGSMKALSDGSLVGLRPHRPGVKDNKFKIKDLEIIRVKYREVIENLSSIFPAQKDAVCCTFLLRLLRVAKMVSVNSIVIADLEKRAGLQLEEGTLSDLLVPSYDHACQTLFDVDLVQRMLDYFLLRDYVSLSGTLPEPGKDKLIPNSAVGKGQGDPSHCMSSSMMRVAKLIDNYLAEVGSDQNLSVDKFVALAEALPEHTRATHDGLYKAIDTYLKAHPALSENERKTLCRPIDCQRLSVDACMHAAQNERLPLRVVVQVLFGEQIKLRNAVTGTKSMLKDPLGTYSAEDDQISVGGSSHDSSVHDNVQHHNPEHSEEEIKVLRSDVERMKGKFRALQHDYTAIQQQLEKLSKHPKNHSTVFGWKRLFPHAHLPHPHFTVPHFLTHPRDIFHLHTKGKDISHHHSKDHEPSKYGRHNDKERDLHFSKEHCSKNYGRQNGHWKDTHNPQGEGYHDAIHLNENNDCHHRHYNLNGSLFHHSQDDDSQHHHSKIHNFRHQQFKAHETNLQDSLSNDDQEDDCWKDQESVHRVCEKFKEHHSTDFNRRQETMEHPDSHRLTRPMDSYHFSYSKNADHISTCKFRQSEDHDRQATKGSVYVSCEPELAEAVEYPILPSEPRRSKDRDSHHSGCRPECSEDSSKSLEGPTTPNHSVEQNRKHTRPIANVIRRWRKSIS